jgi:protein SCO1
VTTAQTGTIFAWNFSRFSLEPGAFVLSVAVFLAPAFFARADSSLPPVLREVRFDQRLNAQVPLDAVFADETGRSVRLGDYLGRKPVILVLAYYRCPMLCTQVLNGLVRSLLDIPFDVGKEFEVVTVSFDPRETPELAAAKKHTYVERYARPGANDGWHFLTGEEPSIKRLTNVVGFQYVYDPRHDQYAHASGIMVLTPKGKIARYFYGIDFASRDLRFGLEEASENRIGSPVDRAVLFFCFHYDPIEGRYGPVIMNLVRLGGVLTILAMGTFIAVMWRQERRKARQPLVPTG